jgi:hypothetical protein
VLIGTAILVLASGHSVVAQDNMFDGEYIPNGYTPVEIRDGRYPRVHTSGAQKFGQKEMRVQGFPI